LDVYITTNMLDNATHPNGQRGYLFHNNRNGTFTNVTDAAGIAGESQSHSATWWDYDNDGWPDLYVTNDYGVPDKLYHNNQDGTFTDVVDQVLPHTSFYSMGSDLGDVNNDGLIDLLVADMATTTHVKDQNSIAESRERDEETDNSPAAQKLHRSALFLNTGLGRCLEAAYLAGISNTNWTWSPRLEDLDNDGRLDLFVTNGFNRDPNPDVNSSASHVETAADRIKVLYNSPVLVETHLAFRSLGDLRFEEVGAEWGLDKKGVSFGTAFGDLSGDGNLDIVYTNYEGDVTVLRNDCDTGHVVNVDLRGTVSNRFGVGATVRIESALGVQARQLVLARGYMSSSEPMLHFGLGGDTSIRRMVVTWPSGHVQEFENLGVDRRYTITEPAQAVAIPPAPQQRPGQFEEVGRATGLALQSREELVDETYLQKVIPVRLNRRGPGLGGPGPLPGRPGRLRRRRAASALRRRRQGKAGPARHQGRQHPSGGRRGVPAQAVPERRSRGLPAGAGRRPAAAAHQRGRRGRSRLRPQRPAWPLCRRGGPAGAVSAFPAKRAPGQPRRKIRGRDRHAGAGPARGRNGDIGALERRGRRRLARPAPDARVGQREVLPQQPGQGIRGLDREGGIRLGGHGLVDLDRGGGLQRRRPAGLRRRQRGAQHPVPCRPRS